MKNKIVSGLFACIAIPQLALGLLLTVAIAKGEGMAPFSALRSRS